jgi:hypothetical protein
VGRFGRGRGARGGRVGRVRHEMPPWPLLGRSGLKPQPNG